jgi:UDP-N-acetylmuramoylalanine--D-glutamate ligase
MTATDATRMIDSFTDTRVTVLGMARSGLAVARLLARHGARVTGSDLRDAATLGIDADALAAEGVRSLLGSHEGALEADLVVVSPGIPKTAPVLREAEARGIPRIGELEVAARFARAPLVAVTGTNGKSTTVTLLGTLFEALGRPVAVGGNVGRALSEVVETVPAEGVLVVEVSSYQLEDVDRFHPRAAALLNVTPDHLDRYDSLDHYRDTKFRIFARQTSTDSAVLPVDAPDLFRRGEGLAARVLGFGPLDLVERGAGVTDTGLVWRDGADTEVLRWEEFPLAGPHNRANAAAALALVHGVEETPAPDALRAGFAAARPLAHRLETVAEVAGVRFIDDSKATNPESLEVALRSFADPVILIAGGKAKDSDYGELVGALRDHAAEIVLVGEGAARLHTAWEPAGLPLHHAGTDFAAAVRVAFARARERGTHVLLSPGCASFDMFRDFEERGDRFRDLARALEDRP